MTAPHVPRRQDGDLSLSAPSSLSILAALADAKTTATIAELHAQAMRKTMAFIVNGERA